MHGKLALCTEFPSTPSLPFTMRNPTEVSHAASESIQFVATLPFAQMEKECGQYILSFKN